MRRFSVLALFMWPVLAAAQDPASSAITPSAGDSVRVSLLDGRRLDGRLQRWTRDSVALRRVARSQTTDTVMSLSHVSVVEHRVRRHTARSAFKGMGLGLMAGIALGALAEGSSDCNAGCDMAMFPIAAGAVVGGVGGLLVGAIRTTSEWEIVWRAEGATP